MRQPPPLSSLVRCPVVGLVAASALGVTFAWWKEANISWLLMNVGQPWGLLTSVLPHLDLIHLAFNLYWLWVFGTLLEQELGSMRFAGLILLLAGGSSAAEFAFLDGGVGLSGVGYGLFGFLWVAERRDARFAGAVDRQTTMLFTGWFFFCILVTILGIWRVANIAHGMGAVLGALIGWTVTRPEGQRAGPIAALAILSLSMLVLATEARSYVNFSDDPTTIGYYGYEALLANKYVRAARHFERALAKQAGEPSWWFNLGIARQQLNEPEKAAAAYQRAVALVPNDPTFREALLNLKVRLGDQARIDNNHELAIRLYREVLSLDAKQPDVWFNLALSCEQLGMHDEMREAFEKASTLKPESKISRP